MMENDGKQWKTMENNEKYDCELEKKQRKCTTVGSFLEYEKK